MMSSMFEIQLIAIVVASSCSILGTYLVLKSMAMISDAITHTILLGIVIAYMITHNLNSPFLIIGAGLVGVLTVYLVEVLTDFRVLKEDTAIGLVFSFLFSVAILIISKYTQNVHLDLDSVLLGELAFATFDKVSIFGYKISRTLITMTSVLAINVLFVIVFFKELKISTFDKWLAMTLGLLPTVIHYMLMTLVSMTAVASFESVGSILVIAFMIGPPITAYLLTDNLKMMIILGMGLGSIASVIGVQLARKFDVSIAGMIAVVIGLIFLITLIVSPKKGIIASYRRQRENKMELEMWREKNKK